MWVIRALLALLSLELALASRVKLSNNGYEDVVVGISHLVSEKDATDVINGIKKRLTDTSARLFAATHQKVYFKDVKILIPKSWTNIRPDEPAMNERYETSDIRVSLINNTNYGHQPYTVQPGNCGVPGLYIHLTPLFMMDDRVGNYWGDSDKILTREWARYRWGVFDEIGYPDDPVIPLFYWEKRPGVKRPKLQPTVCTNKEVDGRYVDLKRGGGCLYDDWGIPDENCRFSPDPQDDVKSSLMGYSHMKAITEFCDDHIHIHNVYAPTRQNIMCGNRSVWDIMNDHKDFIGSRSAHPNTPTTPKFTVIREEPVNFALVLDYSYSMKNFDRIKKLQRAVKRWLTHDVAVGSSVGIITFAEDAEIFAPLTQIVNDNSRRVLANSVTDDLRGGTSIGSGMRLALSQLLVNKLNKVIILISDGEETVDPKISDVMNEVITSGAQVITVAFGNTADPNMEKLALNTGGNSYTVTDIDDGTMMETALQSTLTYQPGTTLSNADVKIYEKEFKNSRTTVKDSFIVDATLGRNLQFRLDANTRSHVRDDPVLTSPRGNTYGNAKFDPSINLWTIDIANAETGLWQWSVKLSGSSRNNIRVTVSAQAKDPSSLPIYTKAWTNTGSNNVDASKQQVIVYARVNQGEKPVVGAKVRAYVTSPDNMNAPVEVELLDNGQGADAQKGDGVYSRYFLGFSTKGRYAVTARVWDEGKTYINNGIFSPNRRRRRRSLSRHTRSDKWDPLAIDGKYYCCGSVVPFNKETATSTGAFSRISGGGSIQVTSLPPTGDYLPPNRVQDLQIIPEALDRISLTWTAPGDDLDSGTVSGYEIHMSKNFNHLMESALNNAADETLLFSQDDSKNVSLDLLREAGETVSLSLGLKEPFEENVVYYIVLRAVDDTERFSGVSNLVILSPNTPHPLPPPPPKFKFEIWHYIVIGALCLLLLLIIICITTRCASKNTSTDEERKPLGP